MFHSLARYLICRPAGLVPGGVAWTTAVEPPRAKNLYGMGTLSGGPTRNGDHLGTMLPPVSRAIPDTSTSSFYDSVKVTTGFGTRAKDQRRRALRLIYVVNLPCNRSNTQARLALCTREIIGN